jgi:Protein of unknown function (DUF2934)
MSDREQRIRERAYQIWEMKGRPERQEEEHWLEAERELGAASSGKDPENLEPAHDYHRDLKRFENGGQIEAKAQEAKHAVDGPERETLKQAEEQGKRRSKGDDPVATRRA